jgi:hypothetical protein
MPPGDARASKPARDPASDIEQLALDVVEPVPDE